MGAPGACGIRPRLAWGPRHSAPAPRRARPSPLHLATWTFLLPLQVSLGKELTLLPAPHCSAGSLLGHFTFPPDPCNSVKRSQATARPCHSWCLAPAHKAQTAGAGPGSGQVRGHRDGTAPRAPAPPSTHAPTSAWGGHSPPRRSPGLRAPGQVRAGCWPRTGLPAACTGRGSGRADGALCAVAGPNHSLVLKAPGSGQAQIPREHLKSSIN